METSALNTRAAVNVPAASARPTSFDVFLAHNSSDKPSVQRIAERLKAARIEPWLDAWQLSGGDRWQAQLADGMLASAACAVFVGRDGVGGWTREELDLAQDRAAKEGGFRLFPVLLPGLEEPFDATAVLPPFLRSRMWVDLRKGVEDTRGFQALVNAIKGVAPGPPQPVAVDADVVPYRGLQTFDVEHVDFFFGREHDTQQLLEQLKGNRFLAVLGPSGSGKSSLVRAGLLPRFKAGSLTDSDRWQARVMTPGAHPLTTLAAHLVHLAPGKAIQPTLDGLGEDERTLHLATSVALAVSPAWQRVVWVIDQFEEIFTLTRDVHERTKFIENLIYAATIPDGPCMVIVTVRADFYARCAAYPDLATQIAARQYLVSPMSQSDLRRVIEEPARAVGLDFERGLVETILEDVERQPGALPLLEHALLELWERRRGKMLTLEAYRETGGVEGALAKRADSVYGGLSDAQQSVLRRVMLRLTQPGEGTEDTRRQASASELITTDSETDVVDQVVGQLVHARLLTMGRDEHTGQPLVDVAHEALIRGWPKLREWVDQDREGLRIHRRLAEATTEWDRQHLNEDFLYRGIQLEAATDWRAQHADMLNQLERDFIDESLRLREAERAAQTAAETERFARIARDRVRTRQLIWLIIASVGIALTALLAFFQAMQASEQRDIANAQRQLARSLQLVGQSAALKAERLDLALLLGLEARRIADTADARGSLLDGLTYAPGPSAYLRIPGASVTRSAYSPDGTKLAAGASDKHVYVWNLQSGRRLDLPFDGHADVVNTVIFSSDGRLLISGGADNDVIVWDAETGIPLGPPLVGHTGGVSSLALSPDGRTLASGSEDQTIILWDLLTRRQLHAPLEGHSDFVTSLAFSPDGARLASGSDDMTVLLWDVKSGQPRTPPLVGHNGPVFGVDFSPDGNLLASAGFDSRVILWSAQTGQRVDELPDAQAGAIYSVAFSPDRKTMATANFDGTVRLWDVVKRSPLGSPLKGHASAVKSVVFRPDGKSLASSGADGAIVVWNTSELLPLGRTLQADQHQVTSVAFSPDGQRFAAAGDDRDITVWDTRTWQSIRRLSGHQASVLALAFDPIGTRLASAGADGTVRLWDAQSLQPVGNPLRLGSGTADSVAFSSDGRQIAATAGDGSISVWDTASGQAMSATLTTDGSAVNAVTFAPDGKTLVSGGADKAVVFWDLGAAGPKASRQIAHRLFVKSLAFSRDGKLLASGSDDQSIVLWDALNRTALAPPLLGHTDMVTALAFNPTGDLLASGSEDHSVILWDVNARRPIGQPIRGGVTDTVNAVAFSPDGQLLAFASANQLTVIDVTGAKWSERACRLANRNLTDLEWIRYLPGEPYRATCPGVD